jgi:hypothetical protein
MAEAPDLPILQLLRGQQAPASHLLCMHLFSA